jgi:threonine dehydratase
MIDLSAIHRAAAILAPYIEKTPLRPSAFFSETSGFDVCMKLENWQPTGSFKVRGALHFGHTLNARERLQGVVAWSAGNHGLGVAYTAKILEMPATIFIPAKTPRSKVEKFRHFPVDLQFAPTYEECERQGRAFAKTENVTILHPYDDWRTVAGQGTVGLEIREVLPELDAVLVPVGGGGLISGIAIAMKALDPEIKIIAVQSANSPSLMVSLQEQHCYEEYPVVHSIAEGIAGGIGRIVYELAPRYIDEIINVDEEKIKETVLQLVEQEQMIVEASGAAALAALDQVESVPHGSRVAAVISGGNLDMGLLREILISGS